MCAALDDLRNQLEGRKDIGFTGQSRDIVEYAVSLLGAELIAVEQQREAEPFYRPVARAESFIELSYYSNSLVPFFALDAIMVTAMDTQAKEYASRNPTGVRQSHFDVHFYETCITRVFEAPHNLKCFGFISRTKGPKSLVNIE